jgi:hypothetical protein
MTRHVRHMRRAFVTVALAAFAGNALATTQRTFVASTGLDTNACSISAPCRSFAAAIAKTNAGGEVIVQDSAGYGPVSISSSISLLAPPGIYAGIAVFTGDGVNVNAPGGIVVLRGLSINGQGGQNGVNLLEAARLRIENCVIANMSGDGVLHTANGAELIVLDTVVRDNLGNGFDVIASAPIVLDHVRSEHNTYDGFAMLSLSNDVTATITDSIFAFNGSDGISVDTSVSSAFTYVLVERSVIADNVANGFVLNGSNAYSVGSLMRNAIHRNGSAGARMFATSHVVYMSLAGNAIISNAAGISADGAGAIAYSSGNTLIDNSTGYRQVNGAYFVTYGNNIGSVSTSGTITPLSGF